MKKTIFFALALIGFFGLKAQSPAVEVSIDGTTAFTITAQFTMNETCTHYAICTAPTGEMGQWASNFGMTMEQLQAIMEPKNFVGRAPQQTEEFITEVINPILESNKDILGMKAEINV